jgi:hypothetical protein
MTDPGWVVCTTPQCNGDGRYASPGRGHRAECPYPKPYEGEPLDPEIVGIGSALVLVMFVAAANDDATDEQRARLKKCLAPLKDEALTASESYVAVIRGTARIMGPTWRPQGEWADWIDRLLEEGKT